MKGAPQDWPTNCTQNGTEGSCCEPHVPVLAAEVVRQLVTGPGGAFVDATVGAGGHAEAILRAAGPEARLLGVDADAAALATACKRLSYLPNKIVLVHGNFRQLAGIAARAGFTRVRGVLFDLGLSSMQLACPERGFSYWREGPLDMRFDITSGPSAAELLSMLEEDEVARLLTEYGEEPRARAIARAIVRSRPIRSVSDLVRAVDVAVPTRHRSKALRRTFQALRIAVNDELAALEEGLWAAWELLEPGGRLAVISFHSLEDRLVKRFMRQVATTANPVQAAGGETVGAAAQIITRRPIRPSLAEVQANPRSRSARLRVLAKL
jgi:16S rRNA (cytosine1402-N4)-methyltransferase